MRVSSSFSSMFSGSGLFPFRSVAPPPGGVYDEVRFSSVGGLSTAVFQPGAYALSAAATRSTNAFHLARGTSVVVRAERAP